MSFEKICMRCKLPVNPDSHFCTKCGTPIPEPEKNFCENHKCVRNAQKYEFESDDLYCDNCGEPTTIGLKVKENI